LLDGNENQAVAAVRSLHRAGHHVTAGADTAWSKAGWSRHAAASMRYPSPRSEPVAFIRSLEDFVRAEPATLVLPLTESSTLRVSENRDRLISAGARLVLADHDILLRTFDKDATRRIAEAAGVATPRTRVVTTLDETRDAVEGIGLPVVLKPLSSEEAGAGGTLRAAGAPRYARTLAQAEAAFEAMYSRSSRILVQEFIGGSGTGYFALMVNGQPRAEFAHRRIRDVRPTGSGSAVRESIAVEPDMREASLAILRELRFHGVAMVEFKRRQDGGLVFLEVNGRFWNSLALAVHAGVDFPSLLAAVAEHGDTATPPPYRVGLRCRWFLGDARHLIAVFAGAPAAYPGRFPGRLQTLLACVTPTPGMRHDNFELSDPLPEIGDWAHFLLRRLPAAMGRRAA
jgi:predicted ATP-grasp superfamily ATP-dependent carboligase